MKRFCAAIISIIFIFLCGCKSPAELLSDFNEKFGSDISRTYSNIGEMLSEAIPGVIEESAIDESEIVVIAPREVDVKNVNLLAYRKLTGRQRKLYSIMLTAVRNMELKDIDVTNYVSENAFSDSIIVHRALLCDNPEIFWMPKRISFLTVKGKDNKYIAFRDYYSKKDDKGFYGITKTERDEMQKKLDAALNPVVTAARRLSGAFNTELYLHDYLCEHVTYDTASAGNAKNANPNSITAYGALVEGEAICEGYSKAMQLLCHKCGIPCNLVFGEHEGVSHMWNIVNPGDGLYYVDTTFDDSSDKNILHFYFNLTKADIAKDHIFAEGYSANKVYDGSETFNFFSVDSKAVFSNYYERNGLYIEEDCILALAAIYEADKAGKKSVELKNITDRSLKSAFNLLCKKAYGTVTLKYCLYYDENNVLIANW